jgi:DNA-binding transcriptional LysR family regulator
MYLRRVNLNLLPILLSLLRSRSVSGAATALDLSQPAVSDALARLRVLLNDRLLVRIGGSMKLTPAAADLMEPLETICADVEGLLRSEKWDPKLLTREIVVASSDICGFLLAHEMVALLREEAPGISLHLIEVERDLTQKMANRAIDFALLPDFAIEDLAPAPLRFAPLVAVEAVAIMRVGHPLAARKTVTELECARFPHIVFQPDAVMNVARQKAQQKQRPRFKVVARVGHLLLVPRLVTDSDAIAFVPRQLAKSMSSEYSLTSRPLSTGAASGDVGIVWSPVYDSDPAHTWFRTSLIARLRGNRKLT